MSYTETKARETEKRVVFLLYSARNRRLGLFINRRLSVVAFYWLDIFTREGISQFLWSRQRL